MEEESNLFLSELQLRYFSDLFLCCDVEKTGKISTLKATELFRSANLTNDIVKQIMSLVAIPQTSIHLSRKQFYSCLKLIAAHQATIPLRQDIITSVITLPLPRFSWKDSPTPTSSIINDTTNGIQNNEAIEWLNVRTPDITIEDTQIDTGNSDQPSTDSEVEQNDKHEDTHRLHGSPTAWSTASDSPTPTNSVALWQGLLCEEQRQLLGTEEESSDRHSSDEDNDVDLETVYQITPEQKEYYTNQFRAVQPDLNGLLVGHVARIFFEKSRIPVEELRHIWQLCDVTRDGALSLGEFTAAMHLVVLRRNNIPLPPQLPPCLISTISTNNLVQTSTNPPEADLLNLGDDDESTETKSNDNNRIIGIPRVPAQNSTIIDFKQFPPSSQIISSISKVQHPTSLGTNEHVSPTALPKTILNRSESNSPTERTSPTSKNMEKDWTQQSKQWTKFTESPTSNVSSPGPKPVNFDMQRTAQAVVSDPQILHPVPLRVTPCPEPLDDVESSRHYRKTENLVYDGIIVSRDNDTSPKQLNQHRDSVQNDIRPIQRPQPKKLLSIGAIPPPPQREAAIGSSSTSDTSEINSNATVVSSKKPLPPLPPPRPHRHARSSSLDLNKLKLNAPPEIPPRISPQTVPTETGNNPSFADFAKFPDSSIEFQGSDDVIDSATIHLDANIQPYPRPLQSLQSSQRTSAFEVYRKPGSRNSQSPPDNAAVTSRTIEYEKRVTMISDNLRHVTFKQDKNMKDILKHLKEQNGLLLKLCNDLSEELLTVQQKKEEVRIRLDNHHQQQQQQLHLLGAGGGDNILGGGVHTNV